VKPTQSRATLVTQLATAKHQLENQAMASRLEALAGIPLTPAQLRVLGIVALSGPKRSRELATSLGVSGATITGLLDRLEATGAIIRVVDPADGRARLTQATEVGIDTLRQVATATFPGFEDMTQGLTDHELECLVIAMNGLARVATTPKTTPGELA
jgi:DNA-binding MarR family transcriptional regulator